MKKSTKRADLTLTCMCLLLLALSSAGHAEAIVADHNAVSEFDLIPFATVAEIGTLYEIIYTHTSHGSQIITGISLLETEDALYAPPYFLEISDDLGLNGDTTWVPATRAYLDNPSYNFNVAMFSWCGGVSDNTEEGINIYLNKMGELEADYPDVVFIYMTGHLDGSGPEGNLYVRNNQIRDYCLAHDKVLFDFADIESYDPDGIWYPDASDACEWCSDWCSSNPCPSCGCAHSHCLNCYLKGKAWWWMMARVSGWSAASYGGPVWHVATDGSDDAGDGSANNPFATIQHAIDQSSSGDTVLVAAGVYSGVGNRDLDFGGRIIVVMSASGAAATTIDCGGSASEPHQGFYFHNGETGEATVDGFTISGAWGSDYSDSAAIRCDSSSATIRNCALVNNDCNGLRVIGDCLAGVYDCVIANNSRYGIWVGALIWPPGSLQLTKTLVIDNGEIGINIQDAEDLLISDCTIAFNGSDGILIQGEPPRQSDGGRWTRDISNCISAFNGRDGISRYFWFPDLTFHCNDSYGNEGYDYLAVDAYPGDPNGNISQDPLFCDAAGRDLTLYMESPCVPPNNSCGVFMGCFGVGCEYPSCGDVDGDGLINITDAVYLVAYIFAGGDPPDPLEMGDVDCSGVVNVSDVVYLLAYIFAGGPEPCASCP